MSSSARLRPKCDVNSLPNGGQLSFLRATRSREGHPGTLLADLWSVRAAQLDKLGGTFPLCVVGTGWPHFHRSDHLRRSVDLSFPSRLQLNLRLFTGCNRAKHFAGGRGGDADIPKNGRRRATQNPPGSFAAAPGGWNLSLPRPSGSELTDLAHHENGTTGSAISTFRIFSLPK